MPVLTVSDILGFLYEGGMIGLHSDGNLIRFPLISNEYGLRASC